MDVTCERCSTEYEFDDALVSERGTTVKCTNCGHQFKVRRTDGISAPERWVVRTVDGRELEFTALRELQAAIAQTRVTKDDVLSRGSTRPRRLGSIAELEPFFANAGVSTSPGLGGRARVPTPTGLGDAPYRGTTEGSVAIPLPTGSRDSSRSPAIPSPGVSPIAVPTPRPGATLPGVVPRYEPLPMPPASGGAPHTPADPPQTPVYAGAAADIAPPPRSVDDPPTIPRAVRVPPEMDPPTNDMRAAQPPAAPMAAVAVTQPSETLPSRQGFDSAAELPRHDLQTTPTPSDVRSSMSDARASYYEGGGYTEPRFSSMTPSRQGGRIRWIGGFVALGVLVFLGLTVGRKYLSAGQKPATSAAPTTSATGSSDERIARHLRDGEASLLEGDLETAKENVDKATALAENDPRVASQAARLAMVRGELAWLRVRALAADDPQQPAARKDLEVAAERARKAADRLAELAPTDPAVPRYRIDALRLSGDREGARKLVPALGATSTQPESALVLAALDTAEDNPPWPSVIERLRTATRSEQKLGRARALLVYALARSGALADAKSELDRLAALPRPNPLVQPLAALLQRADKEGKVVDVGSLPDASHGKRPDPAGATPPAAAPPDGAKPAAPTGTRPRPVDGRVPDDYVWPGYSDDKPPAAATGQPAPAPQPKPETPAAPPGAKP